MVERADGSGELADKAGGVGGILFDRGGVF
jgi:hypothetical protein